MGAQLAVNMISEVDATKNLSGFMGMAGLKADNAYIQLHVTATAPTLVAAVAYYHADLYGNRLTATGGLLYNAVYLASTYPAGGGIDAEPLPLGIGQVNITSPAAGNWTIVQQLRVVPQFLRVEWTYTSGGGAVQLVVTGLGWKES